MSAGHGLEGEQTGCPLAKNLCTGRVKNSKTDLTQVTVAGERGCGAEMSSALSRARLRGWTPRVGGDRRWRRWVEVTKRS